MWPGRGGVIGGAPPGGGDDPLGSPRPSIPTSVSAKGIWTPDDASFYLNNQLFGTDWPTLVDASFGSVVVNVHMDRHGTGNGNLRMLPASRSPTDCDGRETTDQPVAGLTTAARKFGLYSFLCAGASRIVHNINNAITLGSGDFTLEGWIYTSTGTTAGTFWDWRSSGSDVVNLALHLATGGKLAYFTAGADKITDSTALTANTWHHFSACRDTGTVYLYKDGVSVGSFADGTNYGSRSSIIIGNNVTTNAAFPGYVDEFRVTVGVARYPAGTTFTAPTAQFPDY